ncbi:hypothetical protein T439DRAFT_303264 [Meredithblackwellia eburnea MCA 4105]
MRWKLARGKWRPKLYELAVSNPPTLVTSLTSKLASNEYSSKESLVALTTLKGVGPATASALLALYHPTEEPFLSDEGYEGVLKGKAEYTVKGWEKFREVMVERRAKGGWETMEELEKALWSWGVRRKWGEEGNTGDKKNEKKVRKREGSMENVKEEQVGSAKRTKSTRPAAK